jgi:hypothetical protein
MLVDALERDSPEDLNDYKDRAEDDREDDGRHAECKNGREHWRGGTPAGEAGIHVGSSLQTEFAENSLPRNVGIVVAV